MNLPIKYWTPTLAALSLAVASAGHAQTMTPRTAGDDPVARLLQTEGETPTASPPSETDEERITRALNAEVLSQNELAGNQERADAEAYERAQAAWREQTAAAEAERVRYDAEVSANAEAQARYEAALADWRATERACQTGDRARCRAGRQAPAPLR